MKKYEVAREIKRLERYYIDAKTEEEAKQKVKEITKENREEDECIFWEHTYIVREVIE